MNRGKKTILVMVAMFFSLFVVLSNNELKIKGGQQSITSQTVFDKINSSGGIIYPSNPTLYTDDRDNVLAGDTIDFTFTTPEGGLEVGSHWKGYKYVCSGLICIWQQQYKYYGKIKYGWSASTSGFSMQEAYTYEGEEEADFSISIPSKYSGTYYLRIVFDEDIKFGDLKLSNEGKIFSIFSQDNKEITYKYKVLAKNEAPKIYCNGSVVTSAKILKECKLSFSDDLLLSSYKVKNLKTNRNFINTSISGTSDAGISLSEGNWEVTVYDIKNQSTYYDITVDTTAPVWTATDITEVKVGTTLSFKLTDSGSGISNYSSDLWGYKWDTEGRNTPTTATLEKTFKNKTSSEISFEVEVPSNVTKRTTYYLWIKKIGEDNAGNMSSHSGKETYSKATYSSGYFVYKYTIVPEDEEAPKIKYGSTELSTNMTYYKYSSLGIKLTFSDDKKLSYYKITSSYSLMGYTSTSVIDEGNLSGTSYSYTLTKSGTYTIVLEDAANHTTTGKITIDGTSPTIKCGNDTTLSTSLSSPTFINTNCNLSFSDENFSSYSISGAKSASGSGTSYSLSNEGAYTITATDKANNTTTVYLTIDTTAPVISCNNNALSGKITYINKNCTLLFEDDKAFGSYSISGSKTVNNKSVSGIGGDYDTLTSGNYTITLEDKAGNTTTRVIIIDKTAPKIMCNGTALSTSSSSPTYSNTNCNLSFSDDNFSSYSISGTESASGTDVDDEITLSSQGVYTILAYDEALNSQRGYVAIDKTGPVWSLYSKETTVDVYLTDTSSKIYYYGNKNEFYSYAWSESDNSAPDQWNDFDYYDKKNEIFKFTANIPSSTLTKDYYLWIKNQGKDNAGNIADTFEGDKTPISKGTDYNDYLIYKFTVKGTTTDVESPKILCGGKEVTSNVTLPSCNLSFSDDVALAAYKISGKMDTNTIEISGTKTNVLSTLTETGGYTVIVKDAAGKTTERKIRINTAGPKAKLNEEEDLLENTGYFVNSSYTLTLNVDSYVTAEYQVVADLNFLSSTNNAEKYKYPSILKAGTQYSIKDLLGGQIGTYLVKLTFESNAVATKGNTSDYYFNLNDSYLGCIKVNGEKHCDTKNITIVGTKETKVELEDGGVIVHGYSNVEIPYIKSTDNENKTITDVFGNEFAINVNISSRSITESDLCLMINGIKTVPENGKVYYSSSNVTIVNNNVGLDGTQIKNEIQNSTNGPLTKYVATLDDDVRVFYVYVASNPMMSIYEKNTEFAFKWSNTSYSSYMFKTGFEGIAVTGYDLDEGFEFYNWGLKTTNTSSLVINGSGLFSLTLHYANVGTVSKEIMFIFGYNNDMKDEIMEFKTTNNTEIIIEGMTKYNGDDVVQIDNKDVDIYYKINEKINPKIIINDNDGIQKVEISKNVINNDEYKKENDSDFDKEESYSDKSYEISLSFDDKNDEKAIYKIKVIDDFGNSTEKSYILISINRDVSINNGSVGKKDGGYVYSKKLDGFTVENNKNEYNENVFTNIINGKLNSEITLKDTKISFDYPLLSKTLNINYITDLSYDAVDTSNSNSVALYVQACIEKKTGKNYDEFIQEGMHISFKTKSISKLSTSSNSYREGTLYLADLLSYVDNDIFDKLIEEPISGYITTSKVDNLADAKKNIEHHGIDLSITDYSVTISIYNESYKYASFGLYNNLVPVTIQIDENNTSSTNSSVINGNDLVTLDMLPSYKKEQYSI